MLPFAFFCCRLNIRVEEASMMVFMQWAIFLSMFNVCIVLPAVNFTNIKRAHFLYKFFAKAKM